MAFDGLFRRTQAAPGVPTKAPVAYVNVPSFRAVTPPRLRATEASLLGLLLAADSASPPDAGVAHQEGAREKDDGRPSTAHSVSGTPVNTDSTVLGPRSNEVSEPTGDTSFSVAMSSTLAPELFPDSGGPQHPVPLETMRLLMQAYDEGGPDADSSSEVAANSATSGFRWTGMFDAAQAAWIGGTKLLKYGELLPGGVSKAASLLVPENGQECKAELRFHGQRALELGMGRGRLALQLFLSGATVIGVELASERYGIAVAAFERMCHRSSEHFEISKRTAEAIRVRRRGGPKGSICEFRLGSFFDAISEAEVMAATLIFCQVCLPPATYTRVRTLLSCIHDGCRVLMYEDMQKIWKGHGDMPFTLVATPLLSCSWEPERGHRFFVYERLRSFSEGASSANADARAPAVENHSHSASSSTSLPVSGALGTAMPLGSAMRRCTSGDSWDADTEGTNQSRRHD